MVELSQKHWLRFSFSFLYFFYLSFRKRREKSVSFPFFMDSIVGMWDLACIRKDSGNRSRNKTQTLVCSLGYKGLTSNGTRHLATLISVICEFGIGRCLFKEPRSGSLVHVVFLLIVPFSFLTIRSTGLPQIRKESYTLRIGIRRKNPSGLRDWGTL